MQEVGGYQHEVHVGGASQLHTLLGQLHTLVCPDGGVHLKGRGQEGELHTGTRIRRS